MIDMSAAKLALRHALEILEQIDFSNQAVDYNSVNWTLLESAAGGLCNVRDEVESQLHGDGIIKDPETDEGTKDE